MPRRRRQYIPGYAYHVVQRGNNRQACFRHPDDFQAYLALWRAKSRWYGVDVHAYCLMTNHVHFVVTGQEADAISNVMKVVGSCYAGYVNRRYQRTGSLWEGRHRSSLIDSDRYLLSCYRYVEFNPVRAGMVRRPGDYPWSSYPANATGAMSWLVPHASYLALGADAEVRAKTYRRLCAVLLPADDLAFIRCATFYSQPVGDDAFVEVMAERFGLARGYRQRGRPAKRP